MKKIFLLAAMLSMTLFSKAQQGPVRRGHGDYHDPDAGYRHRFLHVHVSAALGEQPSGADHTVDRCCGHGVLLPAVSGVEPPAFAGGSGTY